MAVSRTPRGRWVEEGLRALGDGGLDAVRIKPLAQAFRVTKGGFSWHFADRGALLDEVLDAWERANLEDVIEAVERDGGDARACPAATRLPPTTAMRGVLRLSRVGSCVRGGLAGRRG
jgi:AcrR family transcriptional regulator